MPSDPEDDAMPHPDDHAYFTRRAAHERGMARASDNLAAAEAHLTLAHAYEQLLATGTPPPKALARHARA